MFFCAISGEPPQNPVVSSKSGHIYERRLILKYITENGTDPISGEKLEESDLIPVKASPNAAPPRPPSYSSIPALLQTLQNEWDALVLETFALKQQYNSTRQELSYALYAQDAATRVVARLMKERDAAREALASVQATMGGVPPSAPAGEDSHMQEEAQPESSLPSHILDQMDEVRQNFFSSRKQRKVPDGYVTAAAVKTFAPKHTIPSLHASSPSGITSLAVSRLNPSQFLTGGNDKVVQLYDRSTDKVLASLKGHTKKVNHVAFRERENEPTILLSGGADKIAKMWSYDSSSQDYIPRSTIRTHKGEITGLTVHPTSTIAILSSLDSTYSIHDLSSFTKIFQSVPSDEPFTSLSIHPDGSLLALGTPSSKLQIFDARMGAIATSLIAPDSTPFTVHSSSFSQNGYHLIAPSSVSSVAIWDLRKQRPTHTISLGDNFKVNRVLPDVSTQYLAVSGNEGAVVYAYKSWNELVRFEEGGEVTDLAIGPEGKEIWGVSGREIRIWGPSSEE